MAQAINFEGANFEFLAPPGRDDVLDLLVFYNAITGAVKTPCIVSCWQLSEEERRAVATTGLVFLSILADGMPPVFIGSQMTVGELVRQYGPDWFNTAGPALDEEEEPST